MSPLTIINTATEVMQSHPENSSLDANKLVAIASAQSADRLAEDLLFKARSDAASPMSARRQEISP